MTEWILIITYGIYTISPVDKTTLVQTSSKVEFHQFVDNRSCTTAKLIAEGNKSMRNAECIEVTKKADK
jgi:hypothetical protein